MTSAQLEMPRRARPREGDSYRPAARPAASPRTDEEKQAAAKAEYEKLLTMRSGGTYIPPARLRALQAQITDKTSKEYQRMAWEALKKSINGLINKVNTANIKHIVPELFGENLVRGRGLFCRSIMKAQAASLPFTPVYAAMVAVVNTKLPQLGELLVKRLVMQFRKGFKRNDKAVCLSSTTFLAHLVNQQVQHEMLAGQMLLLLLHKPTDDGIEIAVGFCREVGQYIEEMQPTIAMAVFDQFRGILHEGGLDKRTQYMIEVLFQARKDRFKDHPAVREELDLVEEEDQITHQVNLEGDIDVEEGLNIFKYDPDWEENEEDFRKLKAQILGENSDDDDGDDDSDGSDSTEEEDEETKAMEIKDLSNADLVNLRRTIYLTIMSSADPEEAVHKLMKINLPAGQEPELPSMIVECCSQEKTYTKFFGLIGERFAKINRLWCDLFEQAFAKYYETIHRYENNKLRNIAMLFGHMLAENAIGWHCLSVIHLNEDETTSSSRIFIKILFQAMAEEMGMSRLQAKLDDGILRPSFEGIFPKDNARNIRFSINYFTSIGMGALTEGMREYLQNMPKPALPAPAARDSDSDSVSSYSSYTGSSYSSRSRSRTPPRGAVRGRSPSRSPSRSPARRRGRSWSSDSRSRSRPASSLSRSRSRSRSLSPVARRRRSYSALPVRRAPRGDTRSLSPRSTGRRAFRDGGRSLSRSPAPHGRRARARSEWSPSPPPPRRAAPRSPSPAPRGRAQGSARDAYRRNSSSVDDSRRRIVSPGRPPPSRGSQSPRRRRGRSDSYSPRPPRDGRRRIKASRSPSWTPPPRQTRQRGRSTPPGERRSGSFVPAKRRRQISASLSRSPPPIKRGRRGD